MLKVKNLTTIFKTDKNTVTAVDDISFDVPENSTIGLVGESGSGKSVTALSILQLLSSNGKTTKGKVLWKGKDLLASPEKSLQSIRGKEIGLIFQNPLAALNPVFTIGNQLTETIRLHNPELSNLNALEKAEILLTEVNIPDAKKRLNDYPHQFSLGMCQRIMIAITIAMNPKLLIADEPTASLDVTIQAQILHLLNELKVKNKMSIFLISHDLGVIAQHCDYVLIMYLGKIVESGTPIDIFKSPQHPYTQALINSIPNPDPSIKKETTLLTGDIPSPLNIPTGCRFHTRCPKAFDTCKLKEPIFQNHLESSKTSKVACHLFENNLK
ncbi:ABC transporter ATP-binding protein [bacterium]|nr:ABC transporter ATP-binding protein [bacterium]